MLTLVQKDPRGEVSLYASRGFERIGFLILLTAFLWVLQQGSGWAKEIAVQTEGANVNGHEPLVHPKRTHHPVSDGQLSGSRQGPVTIETQWDPMWGMKYLQNGEELKEPQLKLLLKAKGDPAINTLIDRSEEDGDLATIGLVSSIILSIGCLALPSTHIHLGSLDIAAPYLPVQIPALLLGVAGGFFTNAAGAAKYSAVQRYNDEKIRPGPVTWGLSADGDHLVVGLKYAL